MGGGKISLRTSGFTDNKTEFEKIVALPAKGSTSLTYRVRIAGREYFMKQLHPDHKNDWRYRAAFQKEFEIGSKLHSIHLVKYYGYYENENGPYLLMQNLNGCTIDEKLAQEPAYFCKAKHLEKLFIQLLRGVRLLHRQHVAHLDLKPENILLTQINNDAVILDFGFCLADDYSYTAGFNQEFGAPEQKQRKKQQIDVSTDIYAIGKLMLYIHAQCPCKLSHRMKKVLNKCVQEDRDKRFENVDEVLRTLLFKKRAQIVGFSILVGIIIATLITIVVLQQFYIKQINYENSSSTQQRSFSSWVCKS